MNLEEFEERYGKLPEKLNSAKMEMLLKKRYNKYPLIENLYSQVTAWLNEDGIPFTESDVSYKSLEGETWNLKSLDLTGPKGALKLILIDDYSRFHKKVINKLTAATIHFDLVAVGIRVIWCKKFEWENPNKRTVLKSLVRHVLGLTQIRVFGRNTICEIIPNKDLRAFLDTSSFYGYRNASHAVCLKEKKTGEVLQAMTFGHPYYGKNKYGDRCVECIRSACKPGIVVVGGMTKLLKFYLDNFSEEFDSILYYVDSAHHASDSMGALGFTLSHIAKGGVHNLWVNTGAMMMRTPALHKEIMHAQAVGEILGIPDVGNHVFVFKKGVEVGQTSD
jgi:hypothetical protein